jgi:hypothetical protein
MPPEPRRTDADLPVTFVPPAEPPPQVPFALTDILAHLTRNAELQASVSLALRRDQGMTEPRVEELNRRLANVTRLAGELQAELAALESLRPPDQTGPVIT